MLDGFVPRKSSRSFERSSASTSSGLLSRPIFDSPDFPEHRNQVYFSQCNQGCNPFAWLGLLVPAFFHQAGKDVTPDRHAVAMHSGFLLLEEHFDPMADLWKLRKLRCRDIDGRMLTSCRVGRAVGITERFAPRYQLREGFLPWCQAVSIRRGQPWKPQS